jgi:hypothetical protein
VNNLLLINRNPIDTPKNIRLDPGKIAIVDKTGQLNKEATLAS